MYAVLLPPGVKPIADKYIYHIISLCEFSIKGGESATRDTSSVLHGLQPMCCVRAIAGMLIY
jgi:hypothetical protein